MNSIAEGMDLGGIAGIAGAIIAIIALLLQFLSMKKQNDAEKVRLHARFVLEEHHLADGGTGFFPRGVIYNRSSFDVTLEAVRWKWPGGGIDTPAWQTDHPSTHGTIPARGRFTVQFFNTIAWTSPGSGGIVEVETSCGHIQTFRVEDCVTVRPPTRRLTSS